MRKSKTLFDFFSRSPANKNNSPSQTSKSNGELKSLDSEKKIVQVVNRTPKVLRDEKIPQTKNKLSRVRKSASSPASASSKQTNRGKTHKLEKSTPPKEKNSSFDEENGHDLSEDPMVTDDEEVATPKQPKRRRIIIASESEDSADEYKPGKESESSEDYDDSLSEANDDSLSEASDDSLSDNDRHRKKTKPVETNGSVSSFNKYAKELSSTSTSTPTSSPVCQTTPKSFISQTPKYAASPNSSFSSSIGTPKSHKHSNADSSNKSADPGTDKFKYLHERLEWLMPENIKDKCGRRRSHPDYNPETLYVPESFKKNLTPGLKQWWDLKSDHFDTVLFFKVGKFYEFYHMDAAIGVKELDLSYMKGDFAHAGFPEVAFGKFSDILIHKGYKVARIEQTENPQMMEQRCKKMSRPTKYDKVVRREICQVTSKGTRTLNYEEWSNNMGPNNHFLLTICEKRVDMDSNASIYGICFVDTTIGKFYLGQFNDDRHQSRLLGMIALHPPVEILYDKSSVSQKTIKLFDNNLTGVSKQALGSNSFWDAAKTLKFMSESGYFKSDGDDIELPEAILQMLDKDDKLYQTPLKEYELALKALGACLWYLKRCFIEDCLLSMKLFEIYKPIDEVVAPKTISRMRCKHMILDNVTLHNLAIVSSQPTLKSEETLFGTLNYCETSFGRRELRKWLCSPLYNPDDIDDVQNATDDLLAVSDTSDKVRSCMKTLPDLERLLSKIHVHGLIRNKDHPESRAIFYEMEIYNKRKIGDLISALEGFKKAADIAKLFEPLITDLKSNMLKKCVSTSQEGGNFPQMLDTLSYFFDAFDAERAVKQGSIIPRPGVDESYDNACKEIQDTISELDSYKDIQSKKLGCQIKFVNVGKNRYLLEVPENKKFPSDYEFLGGRKGFKRFYTKDIKELLTLLTDAEEARDSALRDTTRKIFEQFDKHHAMWQRSVQCLSTLDVLLSLAQYYKQSDGKMCRPKFISLEDNTEPFLEVIEGRHPTFVKFYTGKDFIPNSVYIGKKKESAVDVNKGGRVILVTGPNMGGKSTLMRQTGTLLIMAHIGCYVPAESMVLTPVDRIFTRVGANDQIYKGESTFFVESSETASILHHATQDSFVLIDELGRGTATYDGTAIAYSTAHFLANDVGCRTLFSTHYHSLVEDFCDNPNVGLGHMACMVEEDNDCPILEKVTFLYKFADGACPKSYGFNVAKLAGISKEIVCKGFVKAQQIDYGTRISKCLRKLLSVKTPEEIVQELSKKLNALNMI